MRYQLPLSSNPEFVALPSDPTVELTPEQDAALWRGDVDRVCQSILLNAARELVEPPPTAISA